MFSYFALSPLSSIFLTWNSISTSTYFFVQALKFAMGSGGSTIKEADTVEEGGAHILDNTHFFEFHFESATYTIIFVIITLLISILVFSMMWSLYSKCMRDAHCAACVRCCTKDPDPDQYFVPPYHAWGQHKTVPFGGTLQPAVGSFGYPANHLASAPQVPSHNTHAPHSVSNPRFQNRFYLDPTNLVSNHPLLACTGTPQVASAAAAAAAAAPEVSPRFQELPSETPAPPKLEAESPDDPALDKILSSSQP